MEEPDGSLTAKGFVGHLLVLLLLLAWIVIPVGIGLLIYTLL